MATELTTDNVGGRKACSIGGCGRSARSRGMCAPHYHRWRRYGDTNITPRPAHDRSCSMDDCSAKPIARGLCWKHYYRWRNHGDPTYERPKGKQYQPKLKHLSPYERLVRRVSVVGDCWEWQGAKRPSGYGAVCFKGKMEYAHRAMYETLNGPVPDGLWVLHKCDNPPCINPAHLWLGTAKENTRDAIRKGRWTRGLPRLTPQEHAASQERKRTKDREYSRGISRCRQQNGYKEREWRALPAAVRRELIAAYKRAGEN